MRLIDADEFIRYLGLDCKNSREDNVGNIVTLEDFDRQETTYDLDKVVEQLNRERYTEIEGMYEEGVNDMIDLAIKKVKAGGMNE